MVIQKGNIKGCKHDRTATYRGMDNSIMLCLDCNQIWFAKHATLKIMNKAKSKLITDKLLGVESFLRIAKWVLDE